MLPTCSVPQVDEEMRVLLQNLKDMLEAEKAARSKKGKKKKGKGKKAKKGGQRRMIYKQYTLCSTV